MNKNKYEKLTKEDAIALLEKYDKELKRKEYGLVWDCEKEPEKVVEDYKQFLPVLKEDKSKHITTGQEQDNILIEGDNYHALQVLSYTHKGKIDVIYIDPPYNTGNKDFVYNDRFVDKEDGYRHSKWLNFMEKRLDLARDLLTEEGVIFISIDDNEQANLKLLCDKIFGEGKMLMKYEGEVKNDAIFVKTAKETKQNTKRTLVFRSSKLDELQKGNYNTFETATWGEGRISNEDPLVTRYNDIKSVHNVMEIIKQLPHVEKGELTLLKLVFHQHGSPDGTNDIGFRDEHADIILGMLWEKGYKDIEFSDLACNGPVASALETVAKRVDWNGKEERPGTTFSTRGSVVGRIVVNCNSACGTTFRTFGNDNEARKREKHTYTGYFGDMSRPKMSNQYPSYRCWMGDMPNPKMSNPNTLQVHPSITTAIELPEIEFESMDCFKVNKVLPTTQPKFLQNYCNQSIVPNAIAR